MAEYTDYDKQYVHPQSSLPRASLVKVSSQYSIEDLYNELGTIKWIGSDDGGGNAIDVVREFIRSKVE